MGGDARLVVYAADKSVAEKACSAAFERIAALDTMMSDYRKNSELNNLSDRAGGPPVHVSPELFKVLAMAQQISALSDGMFDVTVGPVVQLWRKARKTGILPDHLEIEHARKLVGWQMMTLDNGNQTVKLALPGMRLDLGAIAKGYADDEAQIVLKQNGIKSALVEMGGDMVVSDPPPGTKGWTIEVPNASDKNGHHKIQVANCAISSSGDTEQFVVIGGVRYSHVVNAHTGMAMTNHVEVTITAKDGLIADPLSTALTLVAPARQKELLKRYPGTKMYLRVGSN
jgi:thiamine biosynthesis lipoprotein